MLTSLRHAGRRAGETALKRSAATVVIRLFVLSLVVGLALSVLDIRPETLLADLGDTALRVFDVLVTAIAWSVRYVVIGAIVVVPLWAVFSGLRYLRRGRK
jgi:hypothetical protein